MADIALRLFAVEAADAISSLSEFSPIDNTKPIIFDDIAADHGEKDEKPTLNFNPSRSADPLPR